MGKFATRRALKSLLSRAKLTLYRHQLDGASYQYYAGGYVVNGYLGRRFSMSELKYEMQKGLIFLLKYGEQKLHNTTMELPLYVIVSQKHPYRYLIQYAIPTV